MDNISHPGTLSCRCTNSKTLNVRSTATWQLPLVFHLTFCSCMYWLVCFDYSFMARVYQKIMLWSITNLSNFVFVKGGAQSDKRPPPGYAVAPQEPGPVHRTDERAQLPANGSRGLYLCLCYKQR